MATQDLPLVMKVTEVAKAMNIARQTAYELVHSQGFPAVRVGRCIRIPRDAFLTWLNAQASQAGQDQSVVRVA